MEEYSFTSEDHLENTVAETAEQTPTIKEVNWGDAEGIGIFVVAAVIAGAAIKQSMGKRRF